MLTARLVLFIPFAAVMTVPATAQDLAPHRAAYSVTALEHGKPASGAPGTYAYELHRTCEGYIINQRLRIEIAAGRVPIVSEQQSQMTESLDGKKLHFEHRTTANGRQISLVKGEALLDDSGVGQARFGEPEGQSVALPAGTLFPIAISRATLQHAKAGDVGFDALFFYGEKVKAPQSVNVVIGKVPKRLADLAMPDGAEPLIGGHKRIYYRGGFFEAQGKGQGEQAAFEMGSLTLDNGIELYGTHEEGDSGMEYRITRLETLPRPTCK